MKFSQYISAFSALYLAISPQVIAAKEKRWFEMEVILFSQLGDKSHIKEEFDHSDTELPRYRKVRDLLTPYLYPDVSEIKKHLPVCGEPVTPLFPPVEIPTEFQVKALETLSQEVTDELSLLTSESNEALTETLAEPQYTQDEFVAENVDETSTEIGTNSGIDEAIAQTPNLANNTQTLLPPTTSDIPQQEVLTDENASVIDEPIKPQLSEEELLAKQLEMLTILAQAEAEFGEQPYQFQPINFGTGLCRLSDEVMAELKTDASFDEHYFELTHVNKIINGAEEIYSDKPYLISADSLQLTDLYTQLRRSREFRPLLHIGWRQSEPAINTKRSIPMKLYAGENLKANYERQLEQYLKELKQLEEQELALQAAMSPDSSNIDQADINKPIIVPTIEDKEAIALQNIFQALENMPSDNAELFDAVDNIASLDSDDTLPAPIKPSQDWSIEGLFNVHLNHYLYITADFNIANQTLSENASLALTKGQPQAIKSIRFSQNRRVISKEIHYFDHPYMGMVVQIRRYKKPEPPKEETDIVSQ